MGMEAKRALSKRTRKEGTEGCAAPPLRVAPETLWDALVEQSRARGVPPPAALPGSLVSASSTADRDRQRVKLKYKDARSSRESEKRRRVAQEAREREAGRSDPRGLPALLPEPEASAFWSVMEDYFRHVTRSDVKELLERYQPDQDISLRVPPTGRGCAEAWEEEDAIERMYLEEERRRRHLSSCKSKSNPIPKERISPGGKSALPFGGSSGGQGGKTTKESGEEIITTIISPLENGDDPAEVCDVCNEGESIEGNLILFCDKCNVAVHQICYGVKEVPTGEWLCRRCEEGLVPKGGECILCPVSGGALKPCADLVDGKKVWVHLFCSQWIPETYIKPEDTEAMEPVQNVGNIPKSRWKLSCVICKEKHGACIQCSFGFCAVPFHPSCARREHLLMEVSSQGTDGPVELKAYCSKHSKQSRNQTSKPKESPGRTAEGAAAPAARPAAEPPVEKKVKKESLVQVPAVEQDPPRYGRVTGPGIRLPDDVVTGDMLDSCLEADMMSLLEVLLALDVISIKEIAKNTGTSADSIREWTAGKSNIEVAQTVRTWIRMQQKSGRKTLEKKENEDIQGIQNIDGAIDKSIQVPSTMASPLPTVDGLGMPNENGNLMADDDRLSALLSRLPSEEYLHPHTQHVLESCIEPSKGGSARCVGNRSPESGIVDEEGQRGMYGAEERLVQKVTEVASKGRKEGTAEEEWDRVCKCNKLLAIAPEDEVVGEILILQTELVSQMLHNKGLLDVLGEKVLDDLPEQQQRVEKQVQAAVDVYVYMEAWKASKRIQKKFMKEQQQKAAAKAAREMMKPGDCGEDGLPIQLIDEYLLASTEEAMCVVCGSGESDENNPIVFCDRCEIPVHQKCYSISSIPEGEWLCWPCKEYEDGIRLAGKDPKAMRPPRWQRKPGVLPEVQDLPKCALCPIERGAFKRSKGGKWVHVYCAKYTPEVTLRDNDVADAVEGLGRIKPEMLERKCSWCGLEGAVLSCSYKDCNFFFHPMCARRARFHMQAKPAQGGKVDYRFYCEKHSPMMRTKISQLVGDDGVETERTGITMEEFKKLRRMRFEFERLRTICGRIVKREKLKSEAAMCAIDLARASIKGSLTDNHLASLEALNKHENPRGKRDLEGPANAVQEDTKRLRPTEERLRLDRERLMTAGEAQATNNRLPKGYLYVPLDSFATARTKGDQHDGSSEGAPP